jgi:DHA2 family multidrug resistance protein-like MFS transporter
MGAAVLGSLLTSIYSNKVTSAVTELPGELAATARDNVSAAIQAAASLEREAGDALIDAAGIAFMDGFGVAMLTGAGAALAGALLLLRFMPARDLPSSR